MKYQQANVRNSFLAALSLLFPLIAYGQWWNPLAPKDYNDCIIKNMKEGMGENAVRALQYACIQKYPAPKESKSEIEERTRKEQRYKKCRVETDHYKHYMYFSIDGRNPAKTNQLLDNLKNLNYDSQANSISFQNMNDFGVSAVLIGFTKAKQCQAEIKDYTYSTYFT